MDKTKQILFAWFGCIIAVLIIIGLNVSFKHTTRKNLARNAAITNPNTLEGTYNQIAGLINKITASIYDGNTAQAQPQLLGSGVVISKQCVLTNYHIVADKTDLYVTIAAPQPVTYPVVVYQSNQASDLALLQVTNNVDFPVTGVTGDSDAVDVGDIVFAMGNAFGNGNLLTSGMIIDRSYSYAVNGQAYTSMFRTNINNYPGTCGGPLVNINGEIIGVNNSAGYTSNNYMGIGYATPINKALALLNSNNSQGRMVPTPSSTGSPYMPAGFSDAYSLV